MVKFISALVILLAVLSVSIMSIELVSAGRSRSRSRSRGYSKSRWSQVKPTLRRSVARLVGVFRVSGQGDSKFFLNERHYNDGTCERYLTSMFKDTPESNYREMTYRTLPLAQSALSRKVSTLQKGFTVYTATPVQESPFMHICIDDHRISPAPICESFFGPRRGQCMNYDMRSGNSASVRVCLNQASSQLSSRVCTRNASGSSCSSTSTLTANEFPPNDEQCQYHAPGR